MGLARLACCQRGAAMVEFALVAPAFMLGVFGLIETSRLLWTKQTMADIAYATARCMSVSSTCANTGAAQTYAVNRAGDFALLITTSDVTATANTTCNNLPLSHQVVVAKSVDTMMDGFLPDALTTLRVKACYPAMPSAT